MDKFQQDILEEARTWLGTPWHHNQCSKGFGVDCIQFAMSVYKHVGVEVGQHTNYYRTPKGNSLRDYIETLPDTTIVENIEAGYLLLFKIAGVPHHVAIATSPTTMIHADQRSGKVTEHGIGAWQRKLSTIYHIQNPDNK